MFDAAHEKNIKKTRKTITSVADTKKLCVYQNIQLRGHRDSTKNHPKVGKYCRTVVAWSQGRGKRPWKAVSECLMIYCFSSDFFCFVFAIFPGKQWY